ncbi:MAG: class I SAM-dependent RNA methyltransferase [Myxococcota bacterium]
MELSIESLAAGGDGVAHAADGRVVFVPFTAPGDRVRVEIVETRPRFLRARVVELLAPGEARTDPVCPVFGSCGGCAWQHVSVEAQRRAKGRIVADALRRLGGLAFGDTIDVMPSPDAYGYRVRTRVLRQAGRTGYRRRRSHRLQAVSRCPVLVPALDAALHDLALRDDAPDGEWELAAGVDTVRCQPIGARGDALALCVGDDRLRVSPGAFFQSNGLLHEALAAAVVRAAGTGDSLVEAFAGVGFFTLPLSRAFGRVTAIESNAAAAADLRHNLAAADRGNVDVVPAPLERAWEALPPAGTWVLDPPRSGLPAGSAERLASRGARQVVYLSCDPATLARDLSRLCAQGYRLTEVSAFDLFPQTPHVEVLAILRA